MIFKLVYAKKRKGLDNKSFSTKQDLTNLAKNGKFLKMFSPLFFPLWPEKADLALSVKKRAEILFAGSLLTESCHAMLSCMFLLGSCAWLRRCGPSLGRPSPPWLDSAVGFQEMAVPSEVLKLHPRLWHPLWPKMAIPTGIWSTLQQGRSRGWGWPVKKPSCSPVSSQLERQSVRLKVTDWSL